MAGAEVYLGAILGRQWLTVAEARSGTDGASACEVDPDGELFIRYLYVGAWAGDQGMAFAVGTPGQTFELVVQPVGQMSGVVRDRRGQPVAEAEVFVWAYVPQRTELWPAIPSLGIPQGMVERRLTTHTDLAGRWTLPLPADQDATVYIRRTGFVTASCQVAAEAATRPIEAVLSAGYALTGQVVYDDGRPAAGVRVRGAVTDADGRYRLEGLAPGQVTLLTAPPNVWMSNLLKDVPVGPGAAPAPDIVLIRGCLLEGRVLAGDDGPAVADAAIGCYGPHADEGRATFARTDDEGRFSIRVPPGKVTLYWLYLPDGYVAMSGQTHIEVNVDGQQPPVRIRVAVGGYLRGQVVNPAGQPVAGAEVRAADPPGAMRYPPRVMSAVTDVGGRFGLGSLPVEGELLLQVRTDRLWLPQPLSLDAARLPDGPVMLRLAPAPQRVVTGRLVDEQRQPVGGVKLVLATDGGWLYTRSEADGRFRFGPLNPYHRAARVTPAPGGPELVIGSPARDDGRSPEVQAGDLMIRR